MRADRSNTHKMILRFTLYALPMLDSFCFGDISLKKNVLQPLSYFIEGLQLVELCAVPCASHAHFSHKSLGVATRHTHLMGETSLVRHTSVVT